MGAKQCELCEREATTYCESDQASLCWECDGKVHGANFLVARHTRRLLCRRCQSPTPWRAEGAKLGPAVSVCESCCGVGKDSQAMNDGAKEAERGRPRPGEGFGEEAVEEDDEGVGGEDEEEEEEEEDLSMVSDASSGPPHFHGKGEDQHYDSYQVSDVCRQGSGSLCSAMAPAAALPMKGGKRRKVESGQREECSSLLDDTASSPLFNYSETRFSGDKKDNYCVKTSMEGDGALEFSCGFSATHSKGKSALRKQMGYVNSFVPVKPNPARPVSRIECGRKMR